MKGKSPEESLIPTIRSSSAKRTDGRQVDRAGKHGDVVKGHVNRAVPSNLAKVGINRFRGEFVIKGRDDRHGTGAEAGIRFTGMKSLQDVGFRSPGQHRDTTRRLFASNLDDPAPFLRVEPSELARRAVGVQAMDSPGDQPIEVAAQFRFVNGPIVQEGNDVRCEDALDFGVHETVPSLHLVR